MGERVTPSMSYFVNFNHRHDWEQRPDVRYNLNGHFGSFIMSVLLVIVVGITILLILI